MSVILNIRKRGKLAVTVVAVSLSIWVINEGANSASFRDFFRGPGASSVAVVDGEKISPRDYQNRIKEYETLMAIYNPKSQLDEYGKAQMNEQVLQNTVMETIVGKQCDKLGITTTEDEKKDLIYGPNADQLVRRFNYEGQYLFNNPETNMFDPQRVKEIEKQLTTQEAPQGQEQIYEKIKSNWATLKEYVVRNSRINKFNSMFAGSFFQPMFLAKYNHTEKNSLASIKFVKIPYSSIPDNKITITDDDVKGYLARHRAMFEPDQPLKTIEYVSFEIVPSSADTARAVNALLDAKKELADAKDNKAVINNKSDDPGSYSEAFVNKKFYPSTFGDSIFQLQAGEVYGPYLEGNAYKITKIVARKTLPDSVKVRHILIKTKEQGREVMADSLAKIRIDSIVDAIKHGASFDTMCVKYSEDQGSVHNGGVYNWSLSMRPGISKEFGDFVYEGKTGEKKTVKVENGNYSGYHYIEILNQKDELPAFQLATIAKNLAPSDSTVNALYAKANEFAGRNVSGKDFEADAKKMGYEKRMAENIKASSYSISGIGPSREVVKWAYDHKVGDVSPVFQIGEQRYVVAKMISDDDKGEMKVTAANRPILEQKVREEKKAEEISKMCQGKGSLDAVAAASGQQVQQLDSVNLGANFIPGLGFEPKVVGYTFYDGLKLNTLSPAIKGLGGVYYIMVNNRISLPEDQQEMMKIAQERYQQEMQMKNAIGQILQQTITRRVDVKYYQANF